MGVFTNISFPTELNLQTDYSLYISSHPFMLQTEFLLNPLSISVESNPIQVEILRRSDYDPIRAQSY